MCVEGPCHHILIYPYINSLVHSVRPHPGHRKAPRPRHDSVDAHLKRHARSCAPDIDRAIKRVSCPFLLDSPLELLTGHARRKVRRKPPTRVQRAEFDRISRVYGQRRLKIAAEGAVQTLRSGIYAVSCHSSLFSLLAYCYPTPYVEQMLGRPVYRGVSAQAVIHINPGRPIFPFEQINLVLYHADDTLAGKEIERAEAPFLHERLDLRRVGEVGGGEAALRRGQGSSGIDQT